MKYEPKTTEWMRQNNWGAEAQQLVTDDLTSCESCLAEAEREVERLRKIVDAQNPKSKPVYHRPATTCPWCMGVGGCHSSCSYGG
jgi:hypothetical protein